MRILLINPKRVGRGQSSIRYMNSTPLALPTLKALTPDDVEVRIVDENHTLIPYDEHWDLVGITVMLHVSQSGVSDRADDSGQRVSRWHSVGFSRHYGLTWLVLT